MTFRNQQDKQTTTENIFLFLFDQYEQHYIKETEESLKRLSNYADKLSLDIWDSQTELSLSTEITIYKKCRKALKAVFDVDPEKVIKEVLNIPDEIPERGS